MIDITVQEVSAILEAAIVLCDDDYKDMIDNVVDEITHNF